MHCLHDLTAKSRPTDNVIAFKQMKVLRDCLQREGIQKVGGGRRKGARAGKVSVKRGKA